MRHSMTSCSGEVADTNGEGSITTAVPFTAETVEQYVASPPRFGGEATLDAWRIGRIWKSYRGRIAAAQKTRMASMKLGHPA
jgi:hypothetical protein